MPNISKQRLDTSGGDGRLRARGVAWKRVADPADGITAHGKRTNGLTHQAGMVGCKQFAPKRKAFDSRCLKAGRRTCNRLQFNGGRNRETGPAARGPLLADPPRLSTMRTWRVFFPPNYNARQTRPLGWRVVLAKIFLSPRQGLFSLDHDRADPRPARPSPSVMAVANICMIKFLPVG
jgi:hypothetical protein